MPKIDITRTELVWPGKHDDQAPGTQAPEELLDDGQPN